MNRNEGKWGVWRVRFWLSLLLSFSLLVSARGCAGELVSGAAPVGKKEIAETAEEKRPAVQTAQTGGTIADASAALVPAYERLDIDPFLDDCDRLAGAADAQEAIGLYDALYEQYLRFDSMYTVAYIANSENVTDAYWTQENLFSETQVMSAADALCAACHEVMEGPCAEVFRAHVGGQAADYFAAYEQNGDRLEQLYERESALCSDYYAAMSGVDTLAVSYGGEDWTMERWHGTDGDALYWDDYDAYAAVYERLIRAANEAVGPIYVELVALRQEIAQLCGYENYAEYAYENIYCRDYGPDEAQRFCDQVKALAPRYYEQAYYHRYATGYAGAQMDGTELVEQLGAWAERIDPVVKQAWEYFGENGLYSIGTGSDCMSGGYTTTIAATDAPYIYMSLYGGSTDFYTITHEFGHFVDAWLTPVPNYLTCGGNYDLLEIHSNGLEVLYSAYYGEIFGRGANAAEYGLLAEQLDSVVDGCIFDEFQRRVYAGEDLTLEDINRIYSEICVEYGQYDEVGEDGWWIYVSHNFDSPLYYISYAASSIAALQIWDISRDDYDAAVDAWLAVVREGAYDRGYMEVLAECGLESFVEEGTVEEVFMSALERLEQIG